LDLRNNIIAGNLGAGIDGRIESFTFLDHNALFANVGGACTTCVPDGTNLPTDPLLADPANGDFRLRQGSPLIDAGVDLGGDVNGPAPGAFNGIGPDIGAWESP
jgi:hypothetical protein